MSATDSGSQSGKLPSMGQGRVPNHSQSRNSQQSLWLNGDVVACGCPGCGSPMSIRLWLMVADCLVCGTSIELTEEQEQTIRAMLEKRQSDPASLSKVSLQAILPPPEKITQPPKSPLGAAVQKSARWSDQPAPATASPTKPQTTIKVTTPNLVPLTNNPIKTPEPSRQPPQTVAAPSSNQQAAPKRHQPARQLARRGGLFSDWTCYVVSFLIHLILLLILAAMIPKAPREMVPITLATEINRWLDPGDAEILNEPTDGVEFESPGAITETEIVPEDPDPFEAKAEELNLGPQIAVPAEAPESADFSPEVPAGPIQVGHVLSGRDPRVREQLALQEGGTTQTEAAVARALEWLSRHQHEDGHFGLHDFHTVNGCDGACNAQGCISDTSGTALALLPFLGAGQTHTTGKYREVVSKGLQWLVAHQGNDGDLRGPGDGAMYAHGQSTIALCEAYALTQDSSLMEPAQRGVNFIVAAQHSRGGWRYAPGEPGDTSVVGWQLMALRSAQMAELEVPEQTFENAKSFLFSTQSGPSFGLFSYLPGGSPTEVMTAEALLCFEYFGFKRNDPILVNGLAVLHKQFLPSMANANMYYWYYGTQAFHHYGGKKWEDWNLKMREILISTQEGAGHAAGSWAPFGVFDVRGGRLYTTALAACTLEVYYRHLPLYQSEASSKKARPDNKDKSSAKKRTK